MHRHLFGGTKENHDHLSQDSRYPRRDLNPKPPKYEAGMLITRPQRYVRLNFQKNEVRLHTRILHNTLLMPRYLQQAEVHRPFTHAKTL